MSVWIVAGNVPSKENWMVPVHFSKGMKQKVRLSAFVVDPSLFIVDEPFLGLDPVAIADLIQLLDEERRRAVDSDEHPCSGLCREDVR